MRIMLLASSLCFGLVLLVPAARADAIDGNWCRDVGLRITINGPSIVTPAGTRTQGEYSRHAFSYVIPPGDPDAGATMFMRLLGEEAMQSRLGAQGPIEDWRRCGPPVS
jgi:hypothetical protein